MVNRAPVVGRNPTPWCSEWPADPTGIRTAARARDLQGDGRNQVRLHDGRDDARGRGRGAPAQGRRLSRCRHVRRRRDSHQGESRGLAIAALASVGRFFYSRTPTSSKPSAKTGRWTRSPSSSTTAISTAAAPATTRRRRRVWIANLIRYKREGFKPDRDIIVALTADEEGGGPYNGVEWLLKNKRDLIDAEFCLNEGGWGESVAGKRLSNDVQVSEKYVINYRLEVRNKGGHSSLPVPDNAIYHLAGALDRLSKFAFPLKTNEVTQAYFRAMAKIEDASVRDDLAKVADGAADAMERVARATPAWNATLRTTCVATLLEGGHARTRCRSWRPRT